MIDRQIDIHLADCQAKEPVYRQIDRHFTGRQIKSLSFIQQAHNTVAITHDPLHVTDCLWPNQVTWQAVLECIENAIPPDGIRAVHFFPIVTPSFQPFLSQRSSWIGAATWFGFICLFNRGNQTLHYQTERDIKWVEMGRVITLKIQYTVSWNINA